MYFFRKPRPLSTSVLPPAWTVSGSVTPANVPPNNWHAGAITNTRTEKNIPILRITIPPGLIVFDLFPVCRIAVITFRGIGFVEDQMSKFTRREFLKGGLAAGAIVVSGKLPLVAARQTATDYVTLGRSGVKVTRLAFGTGSFSGQVQRELGQEKFTSLVRYAYDHGIRFFETAESYGEM